VVVGTDQEQVARRLGPMIANTLSPKRRWGAVLHCAKTDYGWEVVVEDLGVVGVHTKPG